MKKFKLLSLIMALAMVLSIVLPFGRVFAAASAEETYDVVVHKVLFKDQNIVIREGGAVGADGATKYTGKGFSSEEFKKYFGANVETEPVEGVWYEAKLNGVVKAEGATGPDGTVKFELPAGTYVIEENKAKTKLKNKYGDKLPAKSVAVTVTLPVYKADGGKFTKGQDALHVYPKNTIDEPTINKSVTESGNMHDTVGIGEIKPFIIESNMPEGIDKYHVLKYTDQLTKGLTYKGNLKVFKNNELIAKSANTYTEAIAGDKGAKIEVSFVPEYIKTLKAGDKIKITFDSTINADAILGAINPNEVELEYGHSSDNTKKKKPENPELHTGGKRFVKRSVNENKVLKDAEFIVKKFGENKYVKINEQGEASFVDTEDQATIFKSGADGIIDIKGLPYGKKGDTNEIASSDYEIIEKKAPEGYALDATPKKFTVNKTSYNQTPDEIEPKPVNPDVINNNKVTIPQTGGIGSAIVVIAGAVIVGIGLYIKKRNSNA
ncbi:SpaH/EbpB family LPXTG-anchored major pilin [Peptostreptococcus sp. D1]|uniref:SpaH/EbpB family LPXTG-anchored major pilin n=1 Tax=Peptostreptococcus sp. D1 TaxID=72304 RepID=UPI0008F0A73F|nr:SpaH/EbpB family LPXTG-anchored major pilin [Peptostreptococcus sp. D1]SFE55648.1 LPXTG-motif cell wall anchor domain-containing protein/fimbrial isopeptide formation D2 domain-containing protein [Peptostreptococcus sp. D1]